MVRLFVCGDYSSIEIWVHFSISLVYRSQKKLKHWMWPGNLRTVPSGVANKKKSRPQWHVSNHQLLEPHSAGYSAGDLQLRYEKVILNHQQTMILTMRILTFFFVYRTTQAYAILPTLGPKRVRLPRAASHHVLNPGW